MNDNKMEYQTPQFMPMTDFELQSVNGGGIPVVVFILVAAVTVVEAAFLVGAAVAWGCCSWNGAGSINKRSYKVITIKCGKNLCFSHILNDQGR